MIEPNAVVRARRALGRRLASYRQAAGYSQHQVPDVNDFLGQARDWLGQDWQRQDSAS